MGLGVNVASALGMIVAVPGVAVIDAGPIQRPKIKAPRFDVGKEDTDAKVEGSPP